MIEVFFFEVYLKAVSLCTCGLLLSIIFCSLTCPFSSLNISAVCSPTPTHFSVTVLGNLLMCLTLDLHHIEEYFLFLVIIIFGIFASWLFTPECDS